MAMVYNCFLRQYKEIESSTDHMISTADVHQRHPATVPRLPLLQGKEPLSLSMASHANAMESGGCCVVRAVPHGLPP
eukprot:82343-Chlamydomonas_euryale.AAC.1